jgi:hypothetical protein
MYSILRGLDRAFNTNIYPKLFYPEIYVMEGGYSQFHVNYPQHCEGQYTKMAEKTNDYSKIPDQAMHLFTYDKKKRSKFASKGGFKISSSSGNF